MRIVVTAALACLPVAGPSAADEVLAAIKRNIDIPAGGLGPALKALSVAQHIHVIFIAEDVRNLQTKGVSGNLTIDEALNRLLEDTGLAFQYIDAETVSIVPISTVAPASDEQTRDRARLNDLAELEEVIVTATKREERLQDVPQSIAVVRGKDVDRRGFIGMEDYLRAIPGVNQIDTGGRDNTIVIRGVTTSVELQNANNNVTVATYFDETPITGAAGNGSGNIDVRPVDIERIEVLRGPQGTALGSSALGGAVRMIPVKPALHGFAASASAAYSITDHAGSDNSMLRGIVNIPLIANELAVRAVGYRYDDSGFYRNTAGTDPATIAAAAAQGLGDLVTGFVQDDVGRMVTNGGRVAVLWRASDKLSIGANLLRQFIEQDGRPVSTTGHYVQSRIPVSDVDRVRGQPGEVADTNIDLANLVVNYDLGWAGLTSAASWVDSGSEWSQAYDHSVIELPSSKATSGFKSFTGELRLASRLEGPWRMLGGLFYEDIDQTYRQAYNWPGAQETNPYGVNPQLLLLSDGGAGDGKQRALFGEASYDVLEKLTATVGGRYFAYQKNFVGVNSGPVATRSGVVTATSADDSGSTFKTSLAYRPNAGAMVYASWSQGFRLGPPDSPPQERGGLCDKDFDGIVDETNVALASIGHIDSDFLDNYELGGKFSLFERRLLVDAAVYHIEWQRLPFRVRPTPSCVYPVNAGSATSDGVEFQASLAVARGVRLDFGAGYTNAQLTANNPDQDFRAGDRLPGSPKFSANLAAQYEFGGATYDAFLRIDSFYTGAFYGDLRQSPGTRSGSYVKLDARAGMTIEQLSVEVFAKNLTDEDAYTWRGQAGAASGIDNPRFGYQLRPRTIGIQLGYNFE